MVEFRTEKGRRSWDAQQKARHLGDTRHAVALSILDYAQKRNMISTEERQGKITTVTRFVGNARMKDALGLTQTELGQLQRSTPAEDFDSLLRIFISDLVSGEVDSRFDADRVEVYAAKMLEKVEFAEALIDPELLTAKVTRSKGSAKPAEPRKPSNLPYSKELAASLEAIQSYKLERIYFSICEVSLEKHTPLLSVGLWSFLESLTAKCGRENTSFDSFLSKDKLASLGFKEKDEVKVIREAAARIAAFGNTTKHHETSANFNGEQLANDMATLLGTMQKLAESAGQQSE